MKLLYPLYNQNWSVICPLDSDKDGKTNGEELGDPNCMWTDRNGFNVSLDNITHPGNDSKCLNLLPFDLLVILNSV